jgi:hypothetical protein
MANKRQNPDNPLTNGKLKVTAPEAFQPTTEPPDPNQMDMPQDLDDNGRPRAMDTDAGQYGGPALPPADLSDESEAKTPPPDKDLDLRKAKEAMEALKRMDQNPLPLKHPKYDGPSLGTDSDHADETTQPQGITLKPTQMIAHRQSVGDLMDFARMVSNLEQAPTGKVLITLKEHAARVYREALAMNKAQF